MKANRKTMKAWALVLQGEYIGDSGEPPFLYSSKGDALDAGWARAVPVPVTITFRQTKGPRREKQV